jgi:hypothetical protein
MCREGLGAFDSFRGKSFCCAKTFASEIVLSLRRDWDDWIRWSRFARYFVSRTNLYSLDDLYSVRFVLIPLIPRHKGTGLMALNQGWLPATIWHWSFGCVLRRVSKTSCVFFFAWWDSCASKDTTIMHKMMTHNYVKQLMLRTQISKLLSRNDRHKENSMRNIS